MERLRYPDMVTVPQDDETGPPTAWQAHTSVRCRRPDDGSCEARQALDVLMLADRERDVLLLACRPEGVAWSCAGVVPSDGDGAPDALVEHGLGFVLAVDVEAAVAVVFDLDPVVAVDQCRKCLQRPAAHWFTAAWARTSRWMSPAVIPARCDRRTNRMAALKRAASCPGASSSRLSRGGRGRTCGLSCATTASRWACTRQPERRRPGKPYGCHAGQHDQRAGRRRDQDRHGAEGGGDHAGRGHRVNVVNSGSARSRRSA